MGTPVVGVTGTIGTGKSTFCEFLSQQGGEHLDADRIAKKLMNPGHAGYQPVVDAFGTAITDEKGYIQPEKLAREVFGDPDKLKRLESILHPLVKERIEERITESRKSFYIIDAPLMFEADVDELCDLVVVVAADPEVVEKRIQKRGMTSRQIEQRRSRQMSQQEKIERADQVIYNNGSLDELRQKANDLAQKILSRQFESMEVSGDDG